MYKDNFLEQQKRYVYNGETEEELHDILSKIGLICDKNYDQPLKPPIGTIIVRENKKNSWIFQKKCFYGWNVLLTKN